MLQGRGVFFISQKRQIYMILYIVTSPCNDTPGAHFYRTRTDLSIDTTATTPEISKSTGRGRTRDPDSDPKLTWPDLLGGHWYEEIAQGAYFYRTWTDLSKDTTATTPEITKSKGRTRDSDTHSAIPYQINVVSVKNRQAGDRTPISILKSL